MSRSPSALNPLAAVRAEHEDADIMAIALVRARTADATPRDVLALFERARARWVASFGLH